MDVLPTPITALYAGTLAVIFIVLSINVVRERTRVRIGILDGGDPALGRAIRVHGNFAEYVPLALVLMLVLELNAGSAWVLHALGVVLVVSRVVHAYGLSRTSARSAGRTVGVVGTWLVVLLAGLLAVTRFVVS